MPFSNTPLTSLPDEQDKSLFQEKYDCLNKEQRMAVEYMDGPLIIVAGAGTGKTNVLTVRTANIMRQGKSAPQNIMAVTFTRKSAQELKGRIIQMVGDDGRRVHVGTFHRLSLDMLRHHAEEVGLRNKNFTIVDNDAQRNVVDWVMENLGIEDPALSEEPDGDFANPRRKKRRSKEWKQLVVDNLSIINKWKEAGLSIEGVEEIAPHDPALDIYRGYQAELLRRNNCDYADLLLHMVNLMDRSPAIAQKWASRFKYILVDEFQDTNGLQYRWLGHLGNYHGNICVVGDFDQSIYKFRNALPGIFKAFSQDWEGCEEVVLHKNYRSTDQILTAANNLINHNMRKEEKRLSSGRSGSDIICKSFFNEYDEANFIAEDIVRHIEAGIEASQIVILLRSSYLSRAIEGALRDLNIDYQMLDGTGFYDREEIKDTLAYLSLANNPMDIHSFMRIANKPTRSVGKTTLDKLVAIMNGNDYTASETIDAYLETGSRITKNARSGLEELRRILDGAHYQAQTETSPSHLIDWILKEIKYEDWLRLAKEDKAEEKLDNISEMKADAAQYTSITDYMHSIAIDAPNSEEGDRAAKVNISTIHGSKGLEFDIVYSPALEDDVLPNARALREEDGLEEERRICHVAWTRARDHLIISYAQIRRKANVFESQFLAEAGIFAEEAAGHREKGGFFKGGKWPNRNGFNSGFGEFDPDEGSSDPWENEDYNQDIVHDDW